MSFDATEMYLIPPRSWRQAQQPPAIRSRIGRPVVEESAIESWDRQDTIQYCNFMNKYRGGKCLTSLAAPRPSGQAHISMFTIWLYVKVQPHDIL